MARVNISQPQTAAAAAALTYLVVPAGMPSRRTAERGDGGVAACLACAGDLPGLVRYVYASLAASPPSNLLFPLVALPPPSASPFALAPGAWGGPGAWAVLFRWSCCLGLLQPCTPLVCTPSPVRQLCCAGRRAATPPAVNPAVAAANSACSPALCAGTPMFPVGAPVACLPPACCDAACCAVVWSM